MYHRDEQKMGTNETKWDKNCPHLIFTLHNNNGTPFSPPRSGIVYDLSTNEPYTILLIIINFMYNIEKMEVDEKKEVKIHINY